MEPTTGIEPVNLFLTKEALYLLSYVGLRFTELMRFGRLWLLCRRTGGAGDEARTRDIQLGRLKLYQLSYSRLGRNWPSACRRLPGNTPKTLRKIQQRNAGSHVVPERSISPVWISYMQLTYGWWWGEDSNLRRLRRQIYSLFPLATREPHRVRLLKPAEGLEPPTH
jgi:hypothetical protein